MTIPMRPSELALLMLAAGGRPPRQRARDQKADCTGADLRQRLLDRLVELDPEEDKLDAALLQIINEMSPPTGPIRAIARIVRDEMRAASSSPSIVEHLIADAVQADGAAARRKT